MKQILLTILATLVVLPVASATAPRRLAEVNVHPGGSLQMAVRQAREMHRLGEADSVVIRLAEGTYRLTQPLNLLPEDSHTAIVGNNAVISGARPVSEWRKEGSLWTANAPVVNGSRVMLRQLWVNGRKALRATQFGQYKLDRILDSNVDIITIPTPKNLNSLIRAPHLEMLVHQRWAIAILRIKSMRQIGDSTQVEFHDPESYLEFSHPWPQPVIGGDFGSSSYCLMNDLSLVDEPGEWYQDESTGVIYYMPREGETIPATVAEVPVTENLLKISGAPGLRVTDITVSGVTFAYSSWTRPSRLGHVTLQGGFPLLDAYKLQKEGLPWAPSLENQAWIERPEAAVKVEWGRRITFNDCSFTHLGATGLDFAFADKAVTASGCTFSDIGGTAILAGSFSEGASEVHRPYRVSPDQEEYCDTLYITSNHIDDATNEDWGAMGIGCGYVRNCSIVGNSVSNVNWCGICLGWGWTPHDTGMRNNRICDNRVTDYARMLYDVGGIYTMSAQPNSFITGNTVSEPSKAPYATNCRAFKLYLDDSSDGFTISGNNFTKDETGTNHPGKNIKFEAHQQSQ